MSWRHFTAEQIIGLLRETHVKLSRGKVVGRTCWETGITEQQNLTYLVHLPPEWVT